MPRRDRYLEDTEPVKRYTFIKLVPFLFLILFLIAFGDQTGVLFRAVSQVINVLLGRPVEPLVGDPARAILIIVYGTFCFLVFTGIWLLIISWKALLPIRTFQEARRTASHLLYYISGVHGPAVFIQDGELVEPGILAETEELKRDAPAAPTDRFKHQLQKIGELNRKFSWFNPGVIVVDFNSAIVLEEVLFTPSASFLVADRLLNVRRLLGWGKEEPREGGSRHARICGAGVVFTSPLERLRGIVDLRKQFRIVENQRVDEPAGKRVYAYTRDGIELHTNQWAIFTLGEPPEVLNVAYIGERKSHNLRVLRLVDLPDGRVWVEKITDELDSPDRREIHEYARSAALVTSLKDYTPLPAPPQMPQFYADRAFNAIYSQARTPDDEILPWHDLPRRVAIDFFRDELSKIDYDDLYKINTQLPLPIFDFKRRVRMRMRNNGVLAFRVVIHLNAQAFEEGQILDPGCLAVTEIRPLTNSKVLRDRGIKVIASGFSDLIPASDSVYQLRLDSWRAEWQKDTDLAEGWAEREAMRVRGKARASAQKELVHSFTRIFEMNGQSEEVLAVRVFQALENLAADPVTRQLLPAETLNLLKSVHEWLLPGRQFPPFQQQQHQQQ